MTERTTCYVPSTPPPAWDAVSPSPEMLRAIHLRLNTTAAHHLALARVESGATAETLVESLLHWLEQAEEPQRQAIYQQARIWAEQRKNQGLRKRKRTYQQS